MAERLTDVKEAIYQRDAHSYWAIQHMAEAAGLTMQGWGDAHTDGLTEAEAAEYDRLVANYHRIFILSLPMKSE